MDETRGHLGPYGRAQDTATGELLRAVAMLRLHVGPNPRATGGFDGTGADGAREADMWDGCNYAATFLEDIARQAKS